MPTPRKTFKCPICQEKTSMTASNYYKQKKKIGFNRCKECSKKAISSGLIKHHKNKPKNKDLIQIACSKCGLIRTVQRRTIKINNKCISCTTKESHINHKESYQQVTSNQRNNPAFKKTVQQGMSKIPQEKRHLNAKNAAKYWKDPNKKKQILSKRDTPEYRNRIKQALSEPEVKMKMSKAGEKHAKKMWANPDYRQKQLERLSKLPGVSKLAETLYSILDDLDIKYYREYNDRPNDPETKIGPWSFDCRINRPGQSDLLIEVHGEIHAIFKEKCQKSEKAKSAYINTYYKDKLEIKYLWHYEFGIPGLVENKIRHWINKPKILHDFDFKDVKIKPCLNEDARKFLNNYHYLSNTNRANIIESAYLNNKLIAVCTFSPLVRQNVDSLGYDRSKVRELSRLCIHPHYQKKNFASWFVSRCIKRLDPKYELIISYADTGFNHNGALYKSCNFTLHSILRPDYWYQNKDGWIMRKKKLYNKATKLNMTESQYALKYGWYKVYGKEKLKFIYIR